MICNLQQKNMDNGISKRIVTNKMAALWHKRERQINGYIAQTVGLLFKKSERIRYRYDYCRV